MIYDDKKALRKHIGLLKSRFTPQQLIEKSQAVISKLEKSAVFRNGQTIMLYWSMSDEVFTHELVEKYYKTKTVLLPVIDGDNLLIKIFTGKKNMIPDSRFGIPEPVGETFNDIRDIDLIITPGVAFDKEKNRLGRGKAFYDRLLKSTKALKAGVCFDFQLVEKVPVDKFDIPMDIIISESKIIP